MNVWRRSGLNTRFMKNHSNDLIIIGAGAAGLLAAGIAASGGVNTILLEKNRNVGRKLSITGKGRCNLTNDVPVSEIMANIPNNGKFLFSVFNVFSPADVMTFFRGLGVELKTERGGRVFPTSDKASDIVNALRKFCVDDGVDIIQATAKSLIVKDGNISGVLSDRGKFFAKNVLVCTGGLSYPGTGSTGDGYRMAREAGHNIIAQKPSLVPLEAEDDYCAQMQGFSLKNVRLSSFDGKGKKIFEDFGELLFTHFGVSGPLVLSASAHMRDFENESYRLEIDLKPALDEKKLDARILRDFAKYSNREFMNALGDLAGRSMIPVLVKLSGIAPETRVNSITRAQRQKLVELFKAFPVKIKGPRPIAEAIITAGGINIREINPRTMESKLVKGLFFAGEVIDTDAYTGGFNLQIAWSTAYAAATSIIERTQR